MAMMDILWWLVVEAPHFKTVTYDTRWHEIYKYDDDDDDNDHDDDSDVDDDDSDDGDND